MPTLNDEVTFISGINPDGSLAYYSFAAWNPGTNPADYSGGYTLAYKWGNPTAGTPGGNISFYFDPNSNWGTAEEEVFIDGLALWSAEANISFSQTNDSGAAQIIFTRGHDGLADADPGFNATSPDSGLTNGTTLLQETQTVVSIDTSVPGFGPITSDRSTYGGYPWLTVIHEEGHALGLGHAGPYNNTNVNSQQFSAFDTRLWSAMSYFNNSSSNQYAPTNTTNWNGQFPTTPMIADILAVQRLYGLPTNTPLSGGQVFGFYTNITGPLGNYFRFDENHPSVMTIWDAGTNNTLDAINYDQNAVINLNPGTFSSIGGLINNIGIAYNTVIDKLYSGDGNDTIIANNDGDWIDALGGNDIVTGGAGNDTIYPGGGVDRIDGGAGTDTAVFNGPSSYFTIVKNSDGSVIVNSMPGNSTSENSTLTNIEILTFYDRSIQTNTIGLFLTAEDFNLNGGADLLLRDPSEGATDIQFTHGALSPVNNNYDSGWKVEAIADFNFDNIADLLWQNDNGQAAIWLMNGNSVLSSSAVASPGAGAKIVGAADFNADGKADIIWLMPTGGFDISYMNGTSVVSTTNIGGPASAQKAWVADFGGDGKPDILFEGVGGSLTLWQLNGNILTASSMGGLGYDLTIRAVGDIDGDGKADVILQNDSTNQILIWKMSGSGVQSFKTLDEPSGPGLPAQWIVRGVADLSGDGHSDIIMQNPATGAVAVYYMANGINIGASNLIYLPVGTAQVVNAGDYINDVIGDAGNNTISASPGDDFVDGSSGIDLVSYASATAAVTIDLSLTRAQNTVGSGWDQFLNVEGVIGSSYNDLINGGPGDDNLNGGPGDDTIFGNGGNDTLDGGPGNDALNGGAGINTLSFASDAAGVTVSLAIGTASGIASGNDTFSNFQNITGGSGNDVLSGNAGNNIIDGGAGIDTAAYDSERAGYTIVHKSDGSLTVSGPDGADMLTSIEFLQFSDSTIPTANAALDFNGDGKSDILLQNDNGQPALWLVNVTTVVSSSTIGCSPGTSWHIRGSGDFDGDGKTDILWQNDNGQAAIWLMNGATITANVLAGANPGVSWHTIATGDFDGDGKADILWQNDNGQAAIWLMNGATITANVLAGANPGASWHAIATGDVNGDGKSDILWQNNSGQVAIWLMNGTTIISSPVVGTNPGTSWHVKGAGDFDGDGKSDILFQNDNGSVAIWTMNGTTVIANTFVGTSPGVSWHVEGTGDYNEDGKADILFQNEDGRIAVWLMNGTAITSNALIGSNRGPDWHAKGSGSLVNTRPGTDFNHDGMSDVLFQNSDGSVAIWTMNGATITASNVVGANPGISWSIRGSGDFDGDGYSDILFQNSDGRVAFWMMNGFTVTSNLLVGDNPGTDWHVMGAGDFDGDGKSDVLFQNDDGSVAFWMMSGAIVLSSPVIGVNPGTAWHVEGVGDFDGDGKSDIVFQKDDGSVAVWTMTGTAISSNVVVGNPGTSWHVAGTGDFDGDGRSDILFQNDDGSVAVWLMNGTTMLSSPVIGANPGTAWHVKGSGDRNADGKNDILFQNDDGSVAAWLMSGTTVLSSPLLSINPGTSWHVIAE